MLRTLTLMITLALACGCGSNPQASAPNQSDASWAPYETKGPLSAKDIRARSLYLTMRDGVRIAVTIYLPGSAAGEKLPTIIQSTRYMRAVDYYWPFTGQRNLPRTRVRRFLANGYAWVAVDARGTGASFGTWPAPWSPDEVKDYGEVVDWVTRQPWSNGKIGACGISYDGSAAEMLATNLRPAVKAVVPEFSLFDAYTDIGMPGGIHLSSFTKGWSETNSAIDRNDVQKILRDPLAAWAVKGVLPVDDDRDGAMLRAAIASHAYNASTHEAALHATFKDDVWIGDPALTIAKFSPFSFAEALGKAGIPFYSYSGWFDGAYQHAAIKRFLTVRTPGSKLTIGPWPHGGGYNSSPEVLGTTRFDHTAELIRFFDFHLKGLDNGAAAEPPIHYYTMVEARWKTSANWPPPAESEDLYLGPKNRLEASAPAAAAAADTYQADYRAATGRQSRWDTLLGGFPVIYPDRRREDRKLLVYTGAPLPNDIEVTGHPLATLYVASTAADGEFFIYLEDVGPDGGVTMVTEGELRGLDRRISTDAAPYRDVVPYHSYLRKDAELLVPGQTAELIFDLIPTSYLFRKGHSLRVAIAAADSDHFFIPEYKPPSLTFFRDATHPSRVTLPIIRHYPEGHK